MGSVGKLCALVAAELALLVTPMMWPTIPFEVGLAAYGLAGALLLFAAGSWLWGLRRPKLVPPTPVQPKLELVFRSGAPFLRQILTFDRTGGKPPENAIEWLIGVRNTSDADAVHNVRVQAVTATQATPGLPATLPPHEGPPAPFSLAPGEMRLVWFIRQRTEIGKRPALATIGSGDGLVRVPCLTPCEMVLAAYADGASATQTVSLSLDDDGEVRISPASFGSLPGGVEPHGNIGFKVSAPSPTTNA